MIEEIISLSDEMVNYSFAVQQFIQTGRPVKKSIADKYIESLEKSDVFSEDEIAFEKKKALRYTAPIV